RRADDRSLRRATRPRERVRWWSGLRFPNRSRPNRRGRSWAVPGRRTRVSSAATAGGIPVRLDRRTRHGPVGTEDAAVPGLGPEDGAAAGAIVEELTGVRRHHLDLFRPAPRA